MNAVIAATSLAIGHWAIAERVLRISLLVLGGLAAWLVVALIVGLIIGPVLARCDHGEELVSDEELLSVAEAVREPPDPDFGEWESEYRRQNRGRP